ncbi:hypothetical protein GGH12_001407 [Coemansia sp. RSA 1822]|nr:hypothetical protein LPJ76_001418 [Coemansia sp. RSA 638]KAJ2565483.1 hypothetical protein GGH12_001407 [Coemansia sp. RSA 1822]
MAKGSSSRRRRSLSSLTPLAIAVVMLSAQCRAIDFGYSDLFNGALGAQGVLGEQASRHYVDLHKQPKGHGSDSESKSTSCDSGSDSDSDNEKTKTIALNVNIVPPSCPQQPSSSTSCGSSQPYGQTGAGDIANILGSAYGHPNPGCTVVPTPGQPYYPTVGPTSGQPCYPTVAPTSGQPIYPTVAPTSGQPYYPTVAPTSGQPIYPTVAPTSGQPYYPTVVPTSNQQYSGVAPTSNQPYYPTVAPTSGQPIYPTVAPTSGQPIYPTVAPTSGQPIYPTVAPTSGQPIYPTVAPTSNQQYSGVAPPSDQPYYPTVAPTSGQPYYPTVVPTSGRPYYSTVAPTSEGCPTVSPTSDNNGCYGSHGAESSSTQKSSYYVSKTNGEHPLLYDNDYHMLWRYESQSEKVPPTDPQVQPPAPIYSDAPQPPAPIYTGAPQPPAPIYTDAPQPPAPIYSDAPPPPPQSYTDSPPPPQSYKGSPQPPAPCSSGAPATYPEEGPEFEPVEHVGHISVQAPRSVRVQANYDFQSEVAPNAHSEHEPISARLRHRPELGDESTTESATEQIAKISSRRAQGDKTGTDDAPDATAVAEDSSDKEEHVQTDFSESINNWDQMLRVTKTADLPALLDKTPSAPTNIDIPKPAPNSNKRSVLKLDPFMAGGVDMYPTVAQTALGHDAPAKIADDVWAVVDSLTPEEKAGQMTQIHVSQLIGSDGQLNATAVEYWVDTMKVGAIVDTPGNSPHSAFSWYSAQALANVTNTVQHIARARGSRVPVLWGLEASRGAGLIKRAAMFPTGIGLAATFQPKHAYAAGRVTAKDSRAAGYQWVFAPYAGISVDKRWGQEFLGFGEDPTLVSQMVTSSVRGLQGDYKKDRARVACCAKGFIGGGEQLVSGQARNMRQITDAHLLEYHLPGFEAAISAGTASIMQAPGSLNGETLGTSPYYLRTLLRDKLRFRGVMLADRHAAIHAQMQRLHSAADARDAIFLALNNTSIDIGEESSLINSQSEFAQTIRGLVQESRVPEDRVTESVARILQLKKDLGLFEQPYADPKLAPLVGADQDVESAQDAVRESITLLKNEAGVLPLSVRDRVLFVGPHLNSTALLGGGWNVHSQGPSDREADDVYQGLGGSVMAAVRKVAGSHAPTAYHSGFYINSPEILPAEFSQLVRLARQADKIVIGLGEAPYSGSPESDLTELSLDAHQVELVKRLHAAVPRAPIVSLLVSGRPRLLKEAGDISAAVVNTHLPGIHGGLPIAEMLYGKYSPSGRQPVTYPRYESQVRDTMWQSISTDYAPAWPFGFGLSYSPMEYSNLTLSSTTLRPNSPITIRMTVHNTGTLDQKEPILLYTSNRFRTGYEPELYRLRRFNKVDVRAGTAVAVEFTLTAEELAYYNRDRTRVIDPTPVNITINALTPNERTISVNLLA